VLDHVDEQVLLLAGAGDLRAQVAGESGLSRRLRLVAELPPQPRLLRHDRVGQRIGDLRAIPPELRRDLHELLLEPDGIDRVLELERRNADHQVHRHVLQVDHLVDQRRLEPDGSIALAVDDDLVGRNPPHALLEVHQPHLGRLGGLAVPVQLERQQVAELLLRELGLGLALDGDVANLLQRHRLESPLGLQQYQVALLRKHLPGVGGTGLLQLLAAPRGPGDDLRRVELVRGHLVGDLGDHHVRAEVGLDQLMHGQRGVFDEHLPLAGGDGLELGVLLPAVRPERAKDGRRQVVHHDVAGSVGGHLAGVEHEGVAVLEDGDLLDRHLRQRL